MYNLLDLFSCQGGGAVGYKRAGFAEIVGVDKDNQPRYPFGMVVGDALDVMRVLLDGGSITDNTGREWRLSDFAAIHASPPCQFGSEQTPMPHRARHPNLIPQTRKLLQESGFPYVIENVENVRRHLENPVMICGSMLGLTVWRHRYFETGGFWCMSPGSCNHSRRPVTFTSGSNSRKLNRMTPVLVTGTTPRSARDGGRFEFSVEECRVAAEVPWMSRDGVDQSIPPVYTAYVGGHLINHLLQNTIGQGK